MGLKSQVVAEERRHIKIEITEKIKYTFYVEYWSVMNVGQKDLTLHRNSLFEILFISVAENIIYETHPWLAL